MILLLVIIFALAVILEIISLKRDLSKLRLEATLSAYIVEVEEVFAVQTTVTNTSLLPVSYLAVNERYPEFTVLPPRITGTAVSSGLLVKRVFRVNQRQRRKQSMDIHITKRGVFSIWIDSMDCGDFLGFQVQNRDEHIRQEIVVYPKRNESPELSQALGKFCGDLMAKRFLIRDPILTVGSREYTGREPMKEIHWTQSAHRGQLMVREFDYNMHPTITILFSVEAINIRSEEGLDECCEMVRSICENLIAHQVTVNYYSNAILTGKEGKKSREISKYQISRTGNDGLLEGLGRTSCFAVCSTEKLMDFARRDSGEEVSYLVVLPNYDRYGVRAAQELREISGKEVLVIQPAGKKVKFHHVQQGMGVDEERVGFTYGR